ncbi:ABC transporter ATP-binding protein [Nocardiopsis aegyptia]|uniref:ABC-2 type transport system ATP-binding protein n=1 Tax=Nocardiopsis aegyptia TaxID=220378 RepID=A0A7Z0EQT6_9ACTN|nr:ABC transporter ATP-binding protein [Nocardiopsis aegyptia]NYJ36577.1 ABC-2 type transport system ATP-binding protein [Nocardiopsis aegyptia]
MPSPAIDVRGLDKYFGRFKALDGLDLTVETGQVAGFLGPNGAGKSTAIRVLLGLLKADGGTARVLGGDPWTDAVALHRRLAYVPGDVALWPNLTGGQAIDLLGRLHGKVDPARKKELLGRFELDPGKKARTYSKGNRQKVALVAALASDAELLILDEPTSGLDPLMESVFTECVREAKAQGRSVLLSSHILAEVEKLCDTVTIIRRGVAVESGTLDEMRHLTRSTVRATTDGDPSVLRGMPGVHGLEVDGDTVTFDVDNTELDGAVRALSGLGLRSLVSNPPSLEELFMRHYGDELAALNGDRAGNGSGAK